MSMEFGNLANAIAGKGRIAAEEILELRRLGWADGKMDPEEAEALFTANDAATAPTSGWCDFFVEALSTFIVNTVEPRGYVDEEMADELIARIDHDGRIDSLAELELLVKVSELALKVPARLQAYTLRQVEEAVLHGEGPTRHGELTPKGINETECALLRRLIFAAGSERPAAVSQSEAELLFRIKDATLYEDNAADWEKLFVQGVANYLLGFGGDEPLEGERVAELEAFMNRQGAGIGSFLGRMLTSKPDADNAFASLLDLGPHAAGIEDEAAEAAELTPEESHWLADLLEADEELDPMEKAVIAFIAEATGEVFSAVRACPV